MSGYLADFQPGSPRPTDHVVPNRAMRRKYGVTNARPGAKVVGVRDKPQPVTAASLTQFIERNNRRLRRKAREEERRARLRLDVPLDSPVHNVVISDDGSYRVEDEA